MGAWFILQQHKKLNQFLEQERLIQQARALWLGQYVYCRTSQGEVIGVVSSIDDEGSVAVRFAHDEQQRPVCVVFDVVRIPELLRFVVS